MSNVTQQSTIVTVPVTSTIGTIAEDTILDRGINLRGAQDDHATAFAELELYLREVINSSHVAGDNKIHTAPVIKTLLRIAKKEQQVLVTSGLIDPSDLLKQFKKIFAEISSKTQKTVQSLPLPIALTSDELILNTVKACKALFEDETISSTCAPELKTFIELYSKFIPYNKLSKTIDALDQELIKAKTEAEAQARKLALDSVAQFETSIKPLNGIASLPKDTRSTIVQELIASALPSIQDTFAKITIQESINIQANSINSLPFATFMAAGETTGQSRHTGGAVTAAIKNLKKSLTNLCQPIAGDEKEININSAVINIALLLDFHPLPTNDIKTQEAIKIEIISGKIGTTQKAGLDLRAKNIALIRGNEQNIFSYVVARHWHITNEAFPELRACSEQTKIEIKNKFVEHMLTRWQYADLSPQKLGDVKEKHGKPPSYVQEENETIEKRLMLTSGAATPKRWEKTALKADVWGKSVADMIAEYNHNSNPNPPASTSPSDFFSMPVIKTFLPLFLTPTQPSSPANPSPTIALLEEQVNNLNTEISALKDQTTDLEKQLKEAQLEKEEIKDQLTSLQKEMTESKKKLNASEKTNNEPQSILQQQIKELNSRVLSQSQTIGQLEVQLTRIQQQNLPNQTTRISNDYPIPPSSHNSHDSQSSPKENDNQNAKRHRTDNWHG